MKKFQFDESLVNYKTDTVDLMYFHGVDEMKDLDTITGRGGALEAARKLVDQGAVRFIGMANTRIVHLPLQVRLQSPGTGPTGQADRARGVQV